MTSTIRGNDDFDTTHPPGLLNIVSTHYNLTTSTSITAYTLTPITAFEAVITPRSLNSKILVIAQWCGEILAGGEENTSFGLSRNGVSIGQADEALTRLCIIQPCAISYHSDDNSTLENVQFHYLDSPGTMNELTYQILASTSSTTTLYTNRTKADTDTFNYERGTSGITLIEIL